MKKIKWPPEKTAVLLVLAQDGLSRREIAARMALDIRAVTSKLLKIGIYAPLNRDGCRRPTTGRPLCPANFPCFEDVTLAEARAIARGAPVSAKPSREHGYSLTGSAADMCAS